MIDEQIAQMRTHRNNIHRYRRLLRTRLTELESQFIEMTHGRGTSEAGEPDLLNIPIGFQTSRPAIRDRLARGTGGL